MSDLDDEELKATREMKAINKVIAPEEKSADEMFEKLGYKKEQDDYNIFYEANYPNGKKYICFELSAYTHCFYGVFEQAGDRMSLIMNMQELKAINKKCKELGWLDE